MFPKFNPSLFPASSSLGGGISLPSISQTFAFVGISLLSGIFESMYWWRCGGFSSEYLGAGVELCSACPAAAVAAPAPAPVAVAPLKVDVDAHGAWPPGVIGETGDIIVVGCVEDKSGCVGSVVVVGYAFCCGTRAYAPCVGGE